MLLLSLHLSLLRCCTSCCIQHLTLQSVSLHPSYLFKHFILQQEVLLLLLLLLAAELLLLLRCSSYI